MCKNRSAFKAIVILVLIITSLGNLQSQVSDASSGVLNESMPTSPPKAIDTYYDLNNIKYFKYDVRSSIYGVIKGLKNEKGDKIIPENYISIEIANFSNKSALYWIVYDQNKKYNIYDSNGMRFFEKGQQYICESGDEYFIVTNNNESLVINKNGEKLKKPTKESIDKLLDDEKTLDKDIYILRNKYLGSGMITKEFEFVVPVKRRNTIRYDNNEDIYILFDRSGDTLTSSVFDYSGNMLWTGDNQEVKQVNENILAISDKNVGAIFLDMITMDTVNFIPDVQIGRSFELENDIYYFILGNFMLGNHTYIGLIDIFGNIILPASYSRFQKVDYCFNTILVRDSIGLWGIYSINEKRFLYQSFREVSIIDYKSNNDDLDIKVLVAEFNGYYVFINEECENIFQKEIRHYIYPKTSSNLIFIENNGLLFPYNFKGGMLNQKGVKILYATMVDMPLNLSSKSFKARRINEFLYAIDNNNRLLVVDEFGKYEYVFD